MFRDSAVTHGKGWRLMTVKASATVTATTTARAISCRSTLLAPALQAPSEKTAAGTAQCTPSHQREDQLEPWRESTAAAHRHAR